MISSLLPFSLIRLKVFLFLPERSLNDLKLSLLKANGFLIIFRLFIRGKVRLIIILLIEVILGEIEVLKCLHDACETLYRRGKL